MVGFERKASLVCREMKSGLEIKDFHDLDTHLNLMRDFAGTLVRIRVTISSGMKLDIFLKDLFLDLVVKL